jgi:hypothetical protein
MCEDVAGGVPTGRWPDPPVRGERP